MPPMNLSKLDKERVFKKVNGVTLDFLLKKLAFPHLSNHPVPDPSYKLAMFAIGDQVEVVGELDVARELFQDVNAEAFAA